MLDCVPVENALFYHDPLLWKIKRIEYSSWPDLEDTGEASTGRSEQGQQRQGEERRRRPNHPGECPIRFSYQNFLRRFGYETAIFFKFESKAYLCRVLGISNIGADCHFWVKTRFKIYIEKALWPLASRPVWPLGGLWPMIYLQFFTLINVVCGLFWIWAFKGP